jgi:CheY-like chemotaxis protein
LGSDSQPHLLLVDDNPAFVENLAEILQGKGYAVQSAGTCASALERTKHGIDVALVDVRLPDGEGTALAKKIKELNQHRK